MQISEADLLASLKCELLFVEQGGYRSFFSPWRSALLLEDSPTCPKRGLDRRCLEQPCPWLSFVPLEHHFEEVPCRHIPLSNCGETIDVLYRTATPEECEECFHNWLVSVVAGFERLAS